MSLRIDVANEPPIVSQPRATYRIKKTPQSLVEELVKSLNLLTIQFIVEETIAVSDEDGRKPKKHFRIADNCGKQVLSATTENVFCTRIGYGRIQHPKLDVKLLYPTDNTHDAFHLFRSLRFDPCFCPCSLQMLEIYNSSKRHLIGSVRQKCNPLNAIFQLCDASNGVMAVMSGQNFKLDAYKVYALNKVEIGSIRLKSNIQIVAGLQCEEMWDIFYTEGLSVELRIMMLGAAFLVDCIYLESPQFLRNH